MYLNLLNQLDDENFRGAISYSRYNEPLADIDLLCRRIEQARDWLPDCKIVTNTNGDYLNPATLYALDVDELTIMDYDNRGVQWCWDRLEDLGATPLYIDDSKNFIAAEYFDMQIRYDFDWQKNALIEDRGNSLKGDFNWKNGKCDRDYACHEPKYFIGIDYDGSVTPCCHIRETTVTIAGWCLAISLRSHWQTSIILVWHGQYVKPPLREHSLHPVRRAIRTVADILKTMQEFFHEVCCRH